MSEQNMVTKLVPLLRAVPSATGFSFTCSRYFLLQLLCSDCRARDSDGFEVRSV